MMPHSIRLERGRDWAILDYPSLPTRGSLQTVMIQFPREVIGLVALLTVPRYVVSGVEASGEGHEEPLPRTVSCLSKDLNSQHPLGPSG